MSEAWKNLLNEDSLTSLAAFAKSRKSTSNLRELEKALSSVEAFSRTRRLRKKYPRPAYIIHSPNLAWCTDLVDMQTKNGYKGHRFILVLLDLFSRKCALEPLKRKTKEQTKVALEKAAERLSNGFKTVASYLVSDGGLEYSNKDVSNFLRKHGIEHRVIITGQKAAHCESFQRSMQNYLYRYLTLTGNKSWVPALRLYEERYNKTVHSTTNHAPNDVTDANSGAVFEQIYKRLITQKRKPPRYQIGDTVRIAEKVNVFSKKYKPMFSKKIYKVTKVHDTPPVYSFSVSSLKGEEINYKFVAEELSPATL